MSLSCQQKNQKVETISQNNDIAFYQYVDSVYDAFHYDSVIGLLENYNLNTGSPLADSLLINHYQLLGRAYYRVSKIRESIAALQIADSISGEAGGYCQQVNVKTALSGFYAHNMQMELALEKGKESVDIAIRHCPELLYEAYISMSRVHFYLDQASDKALEYLLKAKKSAGSYADSSTIADLNYRLGSVLIERDMNDSAEACLVDAIGYLSRNKKYSMLFDAYTALATTWYWREEYPKAIECLDQAQQIIDSLGFSAATNLIHYGIAYQFWNKPDSAIHYYKRTIEEITEKEKEGEKSRHLKWVYDNLAKIYSEQGLHQEALEQYELYMQYRESDFKKKLENSVAGLEVKYQTQEKEQKIKELQKEMEFERKSKRQQFTIIIVLILLIITIIISAFLYHKQKISKEKQEQTVLEQRLLRSQMNPHFILNTFAAIQYFISAKETEQASKYLAKFSKLLRLSLDNSIIPYVPVQEEVEAVGHYLDLQIMRFDRKFTYQVSLYDNFEDDELLIAPMLIQPFVENAIEHGLRGVETGGRIEITIKRRSNSLVCEIDDNGKGLAHQSGENGIVKGRKSLSVEITRQRLYLLGKKLKAESGLEITDKKKNGTESGLKIHMVIPFKSKFQVCS